MWVMNDVSSEHCVSPMFDSAQVQLETQPGRRLHRHRLDNDCQPVGLSSVTAVRARARGISASAPAEGLWVVPVFGMMRGAGDVAHARNVNAQGASLI